MRGKEGHEGSSLPSRDFRRTTGEEVARTREALARGDVLASARAHEPARLRIATERWLRPLPSPDKEAVSAWWAQAGASASLTAALREAPAVGVPAGLRALLPALN